VEMMIVLPAQAALGEGPEQVFQGIAYGALGPAAFRGGYGAAALGVAVHLLISVVAAGLYAWAALRWLTLVRRPLLWGLAYGVVVYVVMNFIVVPLSRIGFSLPKSAPLLAVSFGTHLVFFGLPIALTVAVWRGYRFGRTAGRAPA